MEKRDPLGSNSRPLSPLSRIQKSPLTSISTTTSPVQVKPSDLILDPYDLESHTISKQLTASQRYWYYVEKGVPNEAIAPLDHHIVENFDIYLPNHLKENTSLHGIKSDVLVEVENSYKLAIKQSIVDYILLDPEEQIRLSIPPFVDHYLPRTARAPVPWHESVLQSKKAIEENLYITNQVMLELLCIFKNFENCRIVDMSVMTPNVLPMTLDDFQNILKSQCTAFRTKMLNE